MPPNALDYITIRGFKSIASIEKLPLKACNVLIGANGSGKSNFIGVFEFLHAIREGRLRNYVIEAGGAEKVLHFGSKTTREIYAQIAFAAGFVPPRRSLSLSYDLHIAPTNDDGLYISAESILPRDEDESAPVFIRSFTPRLGQQGEAETINDEHVVVGKFVEWMQWRIGGWRIFHVHDTSSSSLMRKTAKVDDNRFLRPDGSNLAAFLYFLHEREEASYSLIRRTVQRVAPFFDDFRLEPLRLKPDDIKLEWKHKNSDQYFNASSL